MILKELTEQDRKEAIDFMQWVTKMTHQEFEQRKKENIWRSTLVINWCRIRHEYPELNKIWEEVFVRPDREKRFEENKNKILADMSKGKQYLIKEHLLDENTANRITYRVIHKEIYNWDHCITLAIPFDAPWILANKFGASIQIFRSQCPDFFDEICEKYKRYDGSTEFSSNSDKYRRFS